MMFAVLRFVAWIPTITGIKDQRIPPPRRIKIGSVVTGEYWFFGLGFPYSTVHCSPNFTFAIYISQLYTGLHVTDNQKHNL